jgi:MFS-type transporter involved in bile tolerance (Atg22 family)
MAPACCLKCAHTEGSDESNDRERFAFWFAGWGMGPDTINSTWWSVAILALAAGDAICATDPSTGLSSGADGQACTDYAQWNQTAFDSFNGTSCIVTDALNITESYHSLDNAACQGAFAAYRAYTLERDGSAFTCNCEASDPYLFLGGEGGTRPSNVLSYASSVTNLFLAIMLPVVGAWIDTTDWRRQVFLFGGLGCGVATALGSILGPNYVWVGGLFFTVITAILYETTFLGLAPYLSEVAGSDEERGLLAGLRQGASLSAQFAFSVIVGGGALAAAMADIPAAIFGNIAVLVWMVIAIPIAASHFRDREATVKRSENAVVYAFKELWHTFLAARKYPQTFLFLLMHMFASSGVGSIITQLATYGVAQLGMGSTEILILVLVILISAIPASIMYAKCCANRIRPKIIQIATVLWFIIFVVYFSTAVTSKKKADNGFSEHFELAVVGSIMVGIGFGLWYSLNLAHFMKIIPANKKTEFTGLFSAIGYLPRFAPPLLYAALVEATNAHTIAFLSLGLWFLIGLGFLMCIDFERARKMPTCMPAPRQERKPSWTTLRWWPAVPRALPGRTRVPNWRPRDDLCRPSGGFNTDTPPSCFLRAVVPVALPFSTVEGLHSYTLTHIHIYYNNT